MLFALLLGMAMNFLGEVEKRRAPGISFAARTVLRVGVALLGFRITLWEIADLGWQPVALVIAAVSLTIFISIWIAKRGWDLTRCSGCSLAERPRSAAPRPRWPCPPHFRGALKERATLHHHGRIDPSTVAMILYPQ